ncbi:uncharacterized protein LOC119722403 isoform X2 [Patiria miniata]|nr:uncharacterized protein LOC119722403 isoform X2 [Patiria miniata]
MATAGIIGGNGRKCRIGQGSSETACNWYVKYDADGDTVDNWVGLSFGGVPNVGGTGCCASVSDCSTLSGAGAWLKSQHEEYCCGCPELDCEPCPAGYVIDENGCQTCTCVFSCDHWEDYTVEQFAAFAQSPDAVGENGRQCTITTGSDSTACDHYVKYKDLGPTNNWLGLTFGGTPGGSGCCASISDCQTLNGAASWMKAKYKNYCCVPEFTCKNWDSYSDQDFGAMATAGIIGENGRKCRIGQGSSETACNWYVKYDADGNTVDNWVGLSFGAVPNVGGSGCCASVGDCSTLDGAGAWLKSQHKEYCCGPKFSCDRWDDYSAADFGAMATAGIIGDYGRKCRIAQGNSQTFCDWYVKYDADGDAYDNWVGLTWGGVAGLGGSGCCASSSDCSTLNGAGGWLKSEHKQYCCGPEFQCDRWDTYSAADFGAMALAGVIGENGRKCRIFENSCEESSCDFLVKYDIDGNSSDNWQGLTSAGGPGGNGCCSSPADCSMLNGAGAWLKAHHQDICCGPRVGAQVLEPGLDRVLGRGRA